MSRIRDNGPGAMFRVSRIRDNGPVRVNDISLVCRCTFCISCVLKTLIQQVKHNKVPISPIELHSNMNSKFMLLTLKH